MNGFEFRFGTLHCEDVPLPLIAQEVGTPVYVYSTATMQSHAQLLQSELKSLDDPLIAFAVKANPNAAVLATLAAEGLGADVVSGGEYRRARAAGIEAEKIVFSGVGKTADEMALALGGGLFQFNVESFPEAEMLSEVAIRMGRKARVSFRINPDVAAGSHVKISTGAAQDKFGIRTADIMSAFDNARELPGLEPQGLAVHIGSQLTSLDPLEAAFKRLGELIGELRSAGHHISVADLGGGLGVSYNPAAPLPPSPADYADLVKRVCGGWGARLLFEPGRLIVANAGVLLTRVIRVKGGLARPFVVIDAAMNDLMRPTLYDAWHGIEAVVPGEDTMIADIVGPVCETGDTFARERVVERVEPGELMVIRTAGAYAATMGSTYNSRPLAAEVLVNGSEWAVVRRRQEVEELILGDSIPPWLCSARERP